MHVAPLIGDDIRDVRPPPAKSKPCPAPPRKNCECCPRHSLFKYHNVIVNPI